MNPLDSNLLEIWKQVIIKEEPWPYEVSNKGRVRRSKPGPRTHPGRLRKPIINTYGYPTVDLYLDGKQYTTGVHRLVASAFLERPPYCCQVNHIDGIKLNNNATNLEYITQKENIKHAIDRGLRGCHDGEKNGFAKLTNSDVIEIRRLGRIMRHQLIASKYGVHRATISRIIRGDSWTYV